MDLTIIRPLIYVEEKEIRAMVSALVINPIKNPCPADGFTKRTEMKELLANIELRFPGARKNFLKAIENVDSNSFWS
jgi:tRNA(Ile)-lysidine synthase TilS/MesJ